MWANRAVRPPVFGGGRASLRTVKYFVTMIHLVASNLKFREGLHDMKIRTRRMGKMTLLALASLALAGPAPAVMATDSPRIEFASTVHDFGKIKLGDVVKHSFVFTNTGKALLEISDVRPGCGCTTAGTWDKKVEPGKTGIIPLQFNSLGFSGTVTKSHSLIADARMVLLAPTKLALMVTSPCELLMRQVSFV